MARRQAITWTNAGILLIGPLGTNFSEILVGNKILSFKKIHLKISSGKWRPFCLGLKVLIGSCEIISCCLMGNLDTVCFPCLLFRALVIYWAKTWWRHQMEPFSALQALCAGNSTVTGEFPTQRPVTRSFDVFFDMRPNKRLSKQSLGWWFETSSCSLWRQCNEQGKVWVIWSFSLAPQIRGEAMYISMIDFQWYCTKRHGFK